MKLTRTRKDVVRRDRKSCAAAALCVVLAMTMFPVQAGAAQDKQGGAKTSGAAFVPRDPQLKLVYDALSNFRADDALNILIPIINREARRSSATDQRGRLRMARLLSLAGTAFYFDENLYAGLNMFSLATKICPEDTVAKCYLANGLREKADWSLAKKLIEELAALEESQKSVLVHTTIARHYKRVGDYDKALEHIAKAESLDVDNADANLQALHARTLIIKGYGKPASARFKAAAERTLNPYMREIFLANAALVELDEAAQEEHLRAASKLNVDDTIWRVKLAEFCFGHDRETEGDELLRDALQCKRFSSTAYLKMARHLWVNKRFADSEKLTRAYQHRAHDNAESFAMLGEIADARNDAAMAEKHYLRTLSVDPYSTGAYENLVKHYMFKANKPERAVSLAKKFVQDMPSYWPAHFVLAKALSLAGDAKSASEAAQAGLKLLTQPVSQMNLYASHEAGHAHAIIGGALYASKDADGALREAKLFNQMKFEPKLPDYLKLIVMRPGKLDWTDRSGLTDHVALADMLLEADRYDDSISEYRKALEINHDDAQVRAYLLHALSRKGDWGAAAKENFVYSQQVVNKIPSMVDEWSGKHRQSKAVVAPAVP